VCDAITLVAADVFERADRPRYPARQMVELRLTQLAGHSAGCRCCFHVAAALVKKQSGRLLPGGDVKAHCPCLEGVTILADSVSATPSGGLILGPWTGTAYLLLRRGSGARLPI
jgi:hypothetical protein